MGCFQQLMRFPKYSCRQSQTMPVRDFFIFEDDISGKPGAPVRIWDQRIPLREDLERVLDVLVVFETVQNGEDEIERKR